jgi:arylsulfatase A-like enzyme
VKTPSLDDLAKQGIIFNRFYSASSVCSPTRASVLTGRNPLRMNIPTANSGHMIDQEITLPEILKTRGYVTGHFGKWHLGTLTKINRDANRGGKDKFLKDYSIPTMNGYDEYFCTESKVPTFDPMVYPDSFQEGESKQFGWRSIKGKQVTKPYGTAYWRGVEEKSISNLEGEDTKLIMDRAMPFIEHSVNRKKPFFSTIWIHSPHLPVVSDSIHTSFYKDMTLRKQIYYGAITAMDDQIKRLWSKLEELDIADNTIIWFCSDNGPERDTPGSAGEFKGKKRSLYEGGVRVPAFVIWKNQLKGGQRVNFPVVTSDYLPTILDILNIQYPDNRPLDGKSIWKFIEDKNAKRNSPIGFLFENQMSWAGERYKLISEDKGQNFELYDLKNDKGEVNNIINKEFEIASTMKIELYEWINSVSNSKKGNDYN